MVITEEKWLGFPISAFVSWCVRSALGQLFQSVNNSEQHTG